MDLVSVIMPTYNSGLTIEDSIKSVLNQSYKNLELLIIDDGSKDNTKELVKNIKDNRIKYFYKDNSGVSDTRNYGIQKASGKYLFFIDSDDKMDLELISSCMEHIELSDQVIFGFNQIYSDRIVNCHIDDKLINLSNEKEKYDFLINNFFEYYSAWNVWNRCFKKEILDEYNILFDRSYSFAEDQVFCLEYLMHAKSIRLIDKCLYNYKINESSLSHIKIDPVKMLIMLDNRMKLDKDYELYRILYIYSLHHIIGRKNIAKVYKDLYGRKWKFVVYKIIKKYKKYYKRSLYYKTLIKIYIKNK